jgi:hypothetical protein
VPVVGGAVANNGEVPSTVVCPNCWAWSELRKSNRCKRCNTPLMYPDGRRVEVPVAVGGVAAVIAPGSTGGMGDEAPRFFTPLPPAPSAFAGSTTYALKQPADSSRDWVAVARWITLAYGALTVLGLLAFGLLVRHLTLTVTDASTGQLTRQTYDVGAACAILAIVVAALTALFAWLTKFTVARIIFLLITGAGVVGALTQLSTEPVAYALGTGLALLIDVAYGVALIMSIASPRRRPQS